MVRLGVLKDEVSLFQTQTLLLVDEVIPRRGPDIFCSRSYKQPHHMALLWLAKNVHPKQTSACA
jgi:hypothetical protein